MIGLVPLTLEPSHLLTFKIGMSRMIANFLFETQTLYTAGSQHRQAQGKRTSQLQIKPSDHILYRSLRSSGVLFYSVKYKVVSITCVDLPQLLLQRLDLNKSFM